MKILSRGIKPEDKIFRGTCSNCKTEYECLRHEGTYEYDQRDGGGFLRVTCPVCGKSSIAYEVKNLGGSINRYSRPVSEYENHSSWSMARQMEAGVVER